MAVVAIKAQAAPHDSLTNQIVAVGEALDDSAALQLFNYLRIARLVALYG